MIVYEDRFQVGQTPGAFREHDRQLIADFVDTIMWTLNRACLGQSLPIVPVWSCRLVQSLLVLWSWDRPLSYCVVRPPGPGITPKTKNRHDAKGAH
jgi:hypothetical protein